MPGAVYGFLVGKYNQNAVDIYLNVIFFVFVFILSLFFDKYFRSIPKESGFEAFLSAVTFVAGPFGLGIYILQFGMLDFNWIFLFFIALLFMQNRVLKFFVPAIIFAIIMVHFSAVLTFAPALLVILMYLMIKSTDKSKKRELTVVLIISVIVTVAAVLYFALFERTNLNLTMEQLNDLLLKRNSDSFIYYDYSLFGYYLKEDGSNFFSADAGIIQRFFEQISYTFTVSNKMVLLTTTPFYLALVSVFIIILKKVFKNCEKSAEKITAVLMAVAGIIPAFGTFLFSPDVPRWLGHSNCIMMAMIFSLVCFEKEKIIKVFRELISNIKPQIIVFYIIYSLTVIKPYF